MKIIKLKSKNVLSLTAVQIDGESIEVRGKKGAGKTAVIDMIKLGLTNTINRDIIIRQGETEAEILIEMDTGLSINRKYTETEDKLKPLRRDKIQENRVPVSSPQSYINKLFTPLQLDPVGFTLLKPEEQNKLLLNLIEYAWDMGWIKEKFGEIPKGIEYNQHILKVLDEIQSHNKPYYMDRQILNSNILYKKKSAEDIAKDIPANYQYDKWNSYDSDAAYDKLNDAQIINNKIERANAFKNNYANEVRGLEADKQIKVSNAKDLIDTERNTLSTTIERLKAEITTCEHDRTRLDDKLNDKVKIAKSEYNTAKAVLDSDPNMNSEYIGVEPVDTTGIQAVINNAKVMTKHLNEYDRMTTINVEVEEMQEESDELTRKIHLARSLPGEILKTATLPVKGLTVENGVALVNGLPVSNLSDGEKLDLCVDVTIAKYGTLQLILLDGIERLDTKSREDLYAKCKAKGVQIIATRTTDDETLTVVKL